MDEFIATNDLPKQDVLCAENKKMIVKASFRGNPAEERTNFKQATCLLPISVGQSVHEGDKLAATLQLINASFESCTLLVDDTIQRYTLEITHGLPTEIAYQQALTAGDSWILRNQPLYSQLSIPYTIMRWEEWRSHSDFSKYHERVQQQYKQDPMYRTALNNTTVEFLERYAKRLASEDTFDYSQSEKLCLQYLFEECAVMCLWATGGYHYEVYPSGRNTAMAATYEAFIKPISPDLLKSVALRFKKSPFNPVNGILAQPTTRIKKQPEVTLENILAHMPSHVYWKNKDGYYLGCSDLQAQSLGLQFGREVVGKTDFELPWDPSMAAEFRKNDLQVMQQDKVTYVEERARVNGKDSIVLSQKIPLKDKLGNIIGVLGISTDITELKDTQKALEEQIRKTEAANHAKSSFLASISHELRTPLNGILGIADLLTRQKLSAKEKTMVENIATSGKNLLAIVNDLLDISKLEAGKLTLSIKPFGLDKLLKAVYSAMNPLAGKAIKLKIQSDSSIPEKLVGDSLRIRQILTNLINNAIKFTESGTVTVTATCEKEKKNVATLYFTVTDTGIGIPKDKLKTIFERFSQIEAESSEYQRRYGGTGLGLSICRHLLEAMGGEIGVKSIMGKGSTFWFRLPLAIANEKEMIKSQDDMVAIEPFTTRPHILLVEDEPINQFVAKGFLKEFGCTFDLAKKGEEALVLFKKNAKKYKLILMDIRLPDMTGVDITKKIHAMKNIAKFPPIIAMTAHAFEDEMRKFKKAGMLEVITKPIHRGKLYQILKTYLADAPVKKPKKRRN